MLSDRLKQLYQSTAVVASHVSREDAPLNEENTPAITAATSRLRDALDACTLERRCLRHLDLALRKQLASITAGQSCIHRLPDDILRVVFKCIQSTFSNPYHCVDYFALTICTVSHRWRNVARSTATLWTHLSLRRTRVVTVRGIPRRTTPWDHLPILATLCASAPIHIRWNWDFDVSPLVTIVAQLPNAIQTLELTTQWDSLVFLKSDVFASLSRLDLSLCGGLYRFALDHISVLSQLAHLRVIYNEIGPFGRCRPSAPTLPNLSDLSMQLIPGPPLSFIEATLRGCPSLTTLELRCSFADGVPKLSGLLRLDSLTSLLLADTACSLLFAIVAPKADTLSLSVVDNNDVVGSLFAAIDVFMTSSSCTLSTLTFSRVWCSVSPDDMDLCLQRMHALSALYVEDSWDASAMGSFGEVLVQRLAWKEDVVLPVLVNASLRGPCHHYRARVAAAITEFWVSRTGDRAAIMGVASLKEFYTDIAGSDV